MIASSIVRLIYTIFAGGLSPLLASRDQSRILACATFSYEGKTINQIRKWGCHFDGRDPAAFLERVGELRQAYGFTTPTGASRTTKRGYPAGIGTIEIHGNHGLISNATSRNNFCRDGTRPPYVERSWGGDSNRQKNLHNTSR